MQFSRKKRSSDPYMPFVLMTVVFRKEEAAKLEVLDCLFPLDQGAHFLEHRFGGLLLLETSLNADLAASVIHDRPTSTLFKIIPVDSIVKTDIEKISSESLRLMDGRACRVAVECIRRGRYIASSSDVERHVGTLLKGTGCSINLRNPDLVVHINIIDDHTTISVRPPSGLFVKMRGAVNDRS